MKGLRIVPFAPEHLVPVMEIERASNGAPWSERSFRNEFDHPHGRFIVALVRDEVVAFAGQWLVADEAHVTNVAVHPDHRRQGLGERLMVELLERAKDEGMSCSTLEVRAGNAAALALYDKLGYVRAGVRKGYYPDNREDAVVMWLHDLPAWEPPA